MIPSPTQLSSLLIPRPPTSTLFPYTRSSDLIVLNHYSIQNTIWGGCSRHFCAATPENAMEGPLCNVWRRDSCNVSRSEEHTSELQSHVNLVCRLLLEKTKELQSFPLLNCRLL